MTKLFDIFPESLFHECVEKGLVRQTHHPTKPYTILNYTEQCQYEKGNWNEVTLNCRGLIHHWETREVIARPFKKFFNYGDPMCGNINPDDLVYVTDKIDGSLGILYDGDCIATRGSFDSDQAIHATELFRRKYKDVKLADNVTYLFEIVYPENRIVLDYGDMDDLILLGSVLISNGASVINPEFITDWTGPRAQVFKYQFFREALEAPARPNAEGIVVLFVKSGVRIKIKQEDYVRLHKLISGLNERAVWEHLSAGKSLQELLDTLPDEFHQWTTEVADRMLSNIVLAQAAVEMTYIDICCSLPEGFTQKDFAMIAKEHPRKSELFARHAGKSYQTKLWADIYPEAGNRPRATLDNPDTIV